MTRQREYQLRHEALGLCRYCNNPGWYGCCAKHRARMNQKGRLRYREARGLSGPKQRYRCSLCGSDGHNRRTCPGESTPIQP